MSRSPIMFVIRYHKLYIHNFRLGPKNTWLQISKMFLKKHLLSLIRTRMDRWISSFYFSQIKDILYNKKCLHLITERFSPSQIDQSELQHLVAGLGMKVAKEDIESKLEGWDIDRNGTIDFREVFTSLANLFHIWFSF